MGFVKIATLIGALAVAAIAAAATHGAREREAASIPPDELRRYPPIVFLWGDERRVRQTAAADVYVARPGETRVRRLRAWPADIKDRQVYGASQAAWSPNGKQIGLMLAWWCGDPCFDVARMSSEGRGLTRLPVRADILHAAWSSDWRAALTTFQGDDLWTVPMKGGRATRIWRSRGAHAGKVAWAPSGRFVVVATRRGLVSMTRAGMNVVRLTRTGNDVAPVWSPNGRKIAFVRQPACFFEPECDEPTHVFVISSDGSRLRRVNPTANATTVLWTPDSRSVVFVSSADPDGVVSSIYLVGIDDQPRRELVTGRHANPIEWSRDGSKLLFSLEAADRGDELWVMDADGSRQTRLPFHRARWTTFSVDWR